MTIRELFNAVDDEQRVHLVIDNNEESTAVIGTSKGIWDSHPGILDKYVVGVITVDKDELVVRVHKGVDNA